MRSGRRGLAILSMGAFGWWAVACVPPVPVVPDLPSGVGVQWVRDAGGTSSPEGVYLPAWQRSSVLEGSISGPVVAPAGSVVPSPLVFAENTWGVGPFPDGSARFPWSGFAGEGVTDSITPGPGIEWTHTVAGPAGSCVFTSGPSSQLGAIVPSPDATKLAVLARDPQWIGGPGPTTISIVSVGSGCGVVSSATGGTGGSDRPWNGAIVWAPDSSAIAVGMQAYSGGAGSIARLNAAVGATLQTMVDDGPGVRLTPLGWSSSGRLLFSRSPYSPVGDTVTTLESVESTFGWFRTVIDSFAGPTWSVAGKHYGYYVPGTSVVAYNDLSETRINAQGQRVPWSRVRLYDDASTGRGPLPGSDPPFGWHDEELGQVPNAEMVERFVR